MSQEEQNQDPSTTVANIQRIESGYFDHMQSLRERVPVGEYLVEQQTGRWALVAMVLLSLGLLVLFPFTMFYQFTYLVTVVYLAAFIVVGKLFYDSVLVPNEAAETWSD